MARVRSRDTKPEMLVRQIVHSCGYRYRLHCSYLPGTPDLVFRRLQKVIFVHGCFWHAHAGCRNNRLPKSRKKYWSLKIARNRERDTRNLRALKRLGWGVEIIWECEMKDKAVLRNRLKRFLES